MQTHFRRPGHARKRFLKSILLALTSAACVVQLGAQSTSPPGPYWQTVAGGKMAFDVVTVRQNKTAPPNAVSSNFPSGPGDVYEHLHDS
jgi:hypothetical protein